MAVKSIFWIMLIAAGICLNLAFLGKQPLFAIAAGFFYAFAIHIGT